MTTSTEVTTGLNILDLALKPKQHAEAHNRLQKAFISLDTVRGQGLRSAAEESPIVTNRSPGLLVVMSTLLRLTGVEASTDINTLAVTLPEGKANPKMMFSPAFVMDNEINTLVFGLVHEACHTWFSHLLRGRDWCQEPAKVAACEIVVNAFTLASLKAGSTGSSPIFQVLKVPEMVLRKPDGTTYTSKPYDPHEWHAKVKKVLPDLSFETFVRSTEACYDYLQQLPADQQPGYGQSGEIVLVCGGGHGGEGGEEGAGSGGFEDIRDRIVGSLYNTAMNGRGDAAAQARRILEELGKIDPSNPSWGTYPLGALRGETSDKSASEMWLAVCRHLMSTLLSPSDVLAYPRTMLGAHRFFRAMGGAVPLLPVGNERSQKIAIFIDASGSMYGEVITKVAAMVGRFHKAKVSWWSFDTQLYPFQPGGSITGGGGTSFVPIFNELVETANTAAYDAVLILTDGEVGPEDRKAGLALPSNLASKIVWLTVGVAAQWVKDPAFAHKGWSSVAIDAAVKAQVV